MTCDDIIKIKKILAFYLFQIRMNAVKQHIEIRLLIYEK